MLLLRRSACRNSGFDPGGNLTTGRPGTLGSEKDSIFDVKELAAVGVANVIWYMGRRSSDLKSRKGITVVRNTFHHRHQPSAASRRKHTGERNLSLSRAGSGYVETSHDVMVVFEIGKVVLSWDQTTYVGLKQRRADPLQLNRRRWLEIQVGGGAGGCGGGTLAS